MNNIQFPIIGYIHSPFKELGNIPVQPVYGKGIEGMVEILDEYTSGLKDLEGFNYIYLIFFLHKVKHTKLQVIPFWDNQIRGIFSTRAPSRPSHIGLSLVELLKIESNRLYIRDIDILDGTPLLDIKPFIPRIDTRENATSGWLKATDEEISRKLSDNRFD